MKAIQTAIICITLLGTVLLGPACSKTPAAIPSGSWSYALYVNEVKAGSAVFSSRRDGKHYIVSSELSMSLGDVTNTSRQIVTETLDFKPVRLETYNKVAEGVKVQTSETIALFRGGEVELRLGGNKSVVRIEGDFVLDGNFFISRLIENKFRDGYEIKSAIYDPSIELEAIIPVKTRVVGRETVLVGGRKRRLIHITQSIESVKSADSYLDEEGVLVKGVITMLNLTIELVRQ